MTETVNKLLIDLKEVQEAEDRSREEKKLLKRKLIDCESNLKTFEELKDYLESSLSEEKRRRSELGQRRKEILDRITEFQANVNESKNIPLINEKPKIVPDEQVKEPMVSLSQATVTKEAPKIVPEKVTEIICIEEPIITLPQAISQTVDESKNIPVINNPKIVSDEKVIEPVCKEEPMVTSSQATVARVAPTVQSTKEKRKPDSNAKPESTAGTSERMEQFTRDTILIPINFRTPRGREVMHFRYSVDGKFLTTVEFKKFKDRLSAEKIKISAFQYVCQCTSCSRHAYPLTGNDHTILKHQSKTYRSEFHCSLCQFTAKDHVYVSFRKHLLGHLGLTEETKV